MRFISFVSANPFGAGQKPGAAIPPPSILQSKYSFRRETRKMVLRMYNSMINRLIIISSTWDAARYSSTRSPSNWCATIVKTSRSSTYVTTYNDDMPPGGRPPPGMLAGESKILIPQHELRFLLSLLLLTCYKRIQRIRSG